MSFQATLRNCVQRLLEVLAQLAVLGVVAITQHLAGEALEFPRVVIGGREAGDQRLAEAAAAQGRHAGGQHVLRRAAVDPQGLAFEVQLAGVAGGAGDVQVFDVAAGVFMPGETYGQVAGVLRAWALVWGRPGNRSAPGNRAWQNVCSENGSSRAVNQS